MVGRILLFVSALGIAFFAGAWWRGSTTPIERSAVGPAPAPPAKEKITKQVPSRPSEPVRPIKSAAFHEPAESRERAAPRPGSQVDQVQSDRRHALTLARLIDREDEFDDIYALADTPAKLEILRSEGEALGRRQMAAQEALSNAWRSIALRKFAEGEFETSSSPPRSKAGELSLCGAGVDATGQSTYKVVTLRRGEDPAVDEAWAVRDAEMEKIRTDVHAALDRLRN
jgi:hypothetical protein